jgi:hypothetical protein
VHLESRSPHPNGQLFRFTEDLSNLLSKNAFPVNAPLSALHLLSLEGLLAVIQCMADRADNASTPAGKLRLFQVRVSENFGKYCAFQREDTYSIHKSSQCLF